MLERSSKFNLQSLGIASICNFISNRNRMIYSQFNSGDYTVDMIKELERYT